MKKVLEDLAKKPKLFLFAIGLALVLLLGGVDYFTGYEISLSIFYSLPISLVAWFVGKRWGIVLSVIGAATWLWADVAVGHQYSYSLIAFWNAAVRLGYFAIITYTLAALKEALDREKELARTDSLTGIANAKYFYELANSEIYRSYRYDRPVTLAYLDLDDFKKVNDSFGHSEGDKLLSLVAMTIRKNLRLSDIVARVGGDEFAVLLPETGFEQGKSVMEGLRKILLEALRSHNHGSPVTLSIGAITCEGCQFTVDELIKRADALMYSAKSQGKNAVEYEVQTGEEPLYKSD
jgi:diguanylate cyclase (GGDEF)-like protein